MTKSPITVKIKRCDGHDDVPLPQYMSDHAAGLDVCAACDEDITLAAGDIRLIRCGFTMELPIGYEAQIRPRSGLALKHGITLPNSPGTIDADYRGEVGVIMGNMGREPFVVSRGMRIAQMVIAPVSRVVMVEEDELGQTARGAGGFGHTGV